MRQDAFRAYSDRSNPVSVYCDGVGCHVLCLRHGIPVWQHIDLGCLKVTLNPKQTSKNRLDAPTSKPQRRYCIKIITQRVQCECSDWVTYCVQKPERHVLRCQNVADASSVNRPPDLIVAGNLTDSNTTPWHYNTNRNIHTKRATFWTCIHVFRLDAQTSKRRRRHIEIRDPFAAIGLRVLYSQRTTYNFVIIEVDLSSLNARYDAPTPSLWRWHSRCE